ncbi:hypothetical protein DPMN_080179 [Dreissena polymorpha]|uniref:Uncharacterized protein n=1 Tax=Dreissena polymorpha TaxID=45954 RepID=A0A9D3YUK2_DREPO|nr:hypothetical protein DPMN_080179 [Dreissena polymorpha]
MHGIDKDWLSTVILAYAFARRTNYRALDPTLYPYSKITSGIKRDFKEFYDRFITHHEHDKQVHTSN